MYEREEVKEKIKHNKCRYLIDIIKVNNESIVNDIIKELSKKFEVYVEPNFIDDNCIKGSIIKIYNVINKDDL